MCDCIGDVSVPYRGSYFLIFSEFEFRYYDTVSVPYRGSYFLIQDALYHCRLHYGFRPLSGFLLSNRKKGIISVIAFDVSVPYRGSYFLINLQTTHDMGI